MHMAEASIDLKSITISYLLVGGSLEELNYTVLDTFHELESIAPDA